MKKHLYIFLFLFAPITLFAQVQVTKAYIQQYKDIAMKEMKRTGIPASITLAQAIVESSSGESNLAKKFNNHFGIKCKLDWKGETTYQDDDTKRECFRVYPNAYASFKDHSDFLKNRPNYASLFELDPVDDTAWAYGLKKAGYATASDYPKKILKVIDDYELAQYNFPEIAADTSSEPIVDAKEPETKASPIVKDSILKPVLVVQKTDTTPTTKTNSDLSADKESIQLNNVKGVASSTNNMTTSPRMNSIGSITKDTNTNKAVAITAIKKETLNTIVVDTPLKKKTIAYPTNKQFRINQVPAIWVEAGRSFLEIANTYHISLYKLYLFNDLQEMDLVENDQVLFLGAKKKESSKKVHIIKKGETLYDISQSEGMQLDAIKSYNPNIKENALTEGAILYLFKMPTDSNKK